MPFEISKTLLNQSIKFHYEMPLWNINQKETIPKSDEQGRVDFLKDSFKNREILEILKKFWWIILSNSDW